MRIKFDHLAHSPWRADTAGISEGGRRAAGSVQFFAATLKVAT
jgi:hypothetical protein